MKTKATNHNILSKPPKPSTEIPLDFIRIGNIGLTLKNTFSKDVGIFHCTINGKFTYVNDCFVGLLGYSKEEEIIGKKPYHLLSDPNMLQDVRDILQGPSTHYEGRITLKMRSGRLFHCFLHVVKVVADEETQYQGYIKKDQEIDTEFQKQRIQARVQKFLLGISTKFLDANLENIQPTIQSAFRNLARFLGPGTDRIEVHHYDFELGHCVRSYYWSEKGTTPPDEGDKIPLEMIQEALVQLQEGHHLFFPDLEKLPAGSIKDALVAQGIRGALTIPMNLDRKCVGSLVIYAEHAPSRPFTEPEIRMLKLLANLLASFTARARDHRRLQQLIVKVNLQNKQHKDFSFITSHDIRASTANLVAISNLMRQGYSDKFLEMLDFTIDKLSRSIANVNQLLNIEHQELLTRSSCNLKDSVKRVLEVIEEIIEEENIQVETQIPDRVFVSALPNYLDNIFYQLISNAIKYGMGNGEHRIRIDSEENREMVAVCVTDFGDGLDLKDETDKVFQVGTRFHTNNCDGQGMGLYIVRQQVLSLGGDIEMVTSMGKGTSVKVSLPRSEKSVKSEVSRKNNKA